MDTTSVQSNQQQPTDLQALALTKGLAKQETGGKSDPYNQTGASGEYGAYQYLPATWQTYSKRYLGQDNAPMTMENQNMVAYSFVKDKKDQGFSPAQIASMWNAGEGRPNAYKEDFKGTNKQGVKFDTPQYVANVSNYYRQFYNQLKQSQEQTDDTTDDASQAPQEKSLGEEFAGRVKDISNLISNEDNQSIPSRILQGGGAIAGMLGDVAQKGLELIPGVKQVENLLGQGIGKLAQTETGQAVVKAIGDFSQEHPELAKDVGAGFNIATAIPIFKGIGMVGSLGQDAISQGLKGVAEKSFTDALPEMMGNTQKAKILLQRSPTLAQDMIDRGLVGDIEGGRFTGTDDIAKSWNTVTDSNKQISKILSDAHASGIVPTASDTSDILNKALEQFPKSKLTTEDLLDNGERLTPKVGQQWDKFRAGNASLEDINDIRSELDQSTKSIYTKISEPPITKEKAKALADAMRAFVQTQAEDTKPLFQEMSKQFNIQKALSMMDGKAIKPGMGASVTGHVIGTGTGATIGGMIGGTPGAFIGGSVGDRTADLIARKLAGKNIVQGILNRTGKGAVRTPLKRIVGGTAGLIGGVTAQKKAATSASSEQ